MGGASLPPGFRFHPTDEELVGYYLKRKVEGLEMELEVIQVIDLYKFDPWELPEKSFLPKRDMEWFFFCPRDRKYPNGSRTNRATKTGYWKATGKDRKVVCKSEDSNVTGFRKTLVFYRGRAPLVDRTEWVMHEYRLCDDLNQGSPSFQGAFALCRVVKKNERTQRTSDSHVESKAKKVASSTRNCDVNGMRTTNEPLSITSDISSQASYVYNDIRYSSPITCRFETAPPADIEPAAMESNPAHFWVSPDLILDSSKEYPPIQEAASSYLPKYDFSCAIAPWLSYEQKPEISPGSSYSNFNGELELSDDLSQICYMSPYSGHDNLMDFSGNGGVSYEGHQQLNSMRYQNPF